jgi:hypothetical protein
MQARRVLSLSAIALTTVCAFSMLGACGDDSTIVYVYLEAGPNDSGKKDVTTILDDDSGDQTVCNPQPVASFTFKSPGKYLGKCTDDVLGQLYDACISDQNTITGCDAAKAQFADCAGCAFGGATDAVEHPWLVYDDRVTAFPNFGLCMATLRGESSPTECGVAYGQFYTCLNQACVTPCAELQDSNAFDACRQAALDNGICKNGAQTALGTKCTASYKETDPTYGFCTSVKDEHGKDLDDRGYMLALARLTCGTDPNPDAGVTDGGTVADASDAGDAGDAGDADASL